MKHPTFTHFSLQEQGNCRYQTSPAVCNRTAHEVRS